MKKVCGITLKANKLISVVLEGTTNDYQVVPTPYDSYPLKDSKDQETVRRFREELLEFFGYEDFHAIGIRERMSKGRFAGGAITFKIEGLLQTSDYPVAIVHANSIKSKTKDAIIDTSLVKAYQKEAMVLAYYLLATTD